MIAARPLSSPKLHVASPRALLTTAAVLLGAILATPVEGAMTALPSSTEITERVRAALPPGWSVQQTLAPVLPPGWQSPDATAVTVTVNHGGTVQTLSFVSLDWIGVQNRGAVPESVRFGSTAKVIVASGSSDGLGWLDAIAPHSASLASPSGTTAFHVGEYPQAEAAIRTFLRKSGVPRDQLAASFIALGVPAEDLIRETALDTRNPARLAAIRSLRHFPGKATREALHKIIADRSKDAAADKCRLAAIDTCEILLIDGHGPAVLAALQIEKDESVATRLADELNRLRFTAAAPELRRWLKASQALESKVSFARALATVRDTAAAAEIETALTAPTGKRAAVVSSNDGTARRQLQIELQRLTGSWGPAAHGARISVAIESPDRVLIHLENMSDGQFRFIPFGSEGGPTWPVGLEVTIDGRVITPPGPGDAELGRLTEITRSLAPGHATRFELNLPSPLAANGDSTLRATWFDLTSNELTARAAR